MGDKGQRGDGGFVGPPGKSGIPVSKHSLYLSFLLGSSYILLQFTYLGKCTTMYLSEGDIFVRLKMNSLIRLSLKSLTYLEIYVIVR